MFQPIFHPTNQSFGITTDYLNEGSFAWKIFQLLGDGMEHDVEGGCLQLGAGGTQQLQGRVEYGTHRPRTPAGHLHCCRTVTTRFNSNCYYIVLNE
jgi:hypothetical protein